jgi:SAM-dependent methyltransferase
MIYQHPLAYLLGLEGIALLRAWAGEYDRAFVQARLAEVRRLLDNDAGHLAARGHQVVGVDSSPDMLDRARARVPQEMSSCSGTCTSCRCPMTPWTLSSPVWHWPTCRRWRR